MAAEEMNDEVKVALANFLGATLAFRDLNDEELNELLNFVELLRVPANYLLFKEGELGDKIYFLWEGEIEIIKSIEHKARAALVKLLPGATFGELAVIENATRSTSAKAVVESLLVSLSQENIDIMFRDKPQLLTRVLWSLLQLLSMRLRDTNEKVAKAVKWGYEIAEAMEAELPEPPPEIKDEVERLTESD